MSKIREVEETKYGLYLWQMPDGKLVADEDMNWLCIPSVKGDLSKIQNITNVARSYGITEGEAVFLAGRRQVTDEEYEEQKSRAALGLIPDPYDVPALKSEAAYRKANGLD